MGAIDKKSIGWSDEEYPRPMVGYVKGEWFLIAKHKADDIIAKMEKDEKEKERREKLTPEEKAAEDLAGEKKAKEEEERLAKRTPEEVEADDYDANKSSMDIAHALDTYDEDYDLLEKLGIREKPIGRQIAYEDMTEQQKTEHDKELEDRKEWKRQSLIIIEEAQQKLNDAKKICAEAIEEMEGLKKEVEARKESLV